MDSQWVVLTEHYVQLAEASLDAETILMLSFEDVLNDEGIEFAYDPFRPGEGGYSGRSFHQPIRMCIPQGDLERAKALLDEFRSAPIEFEDFDGDIMGGVVTDELQALPRRWRFPDDAAGARRWALLLALILAATYAGFLFSCIGVELTVGAWDIWRHELPYLIAVLVSPLFVFLGNFLWFWLVAGVLVKARMHRKAA